MFKGVKWDIDCEGNRLNLNERPKKITKTKINTNIQNEDCLHWSMDAPSFFTSTHNHCVRCDGWVHGSPLLFLL